LAYRLHTGNDPATDLRGVGFLSLMQLLYFVTEPKTQQLAHSVYKLSLHHAQARHTVFNIHTIYSYIRAGDRTAVSGSPGQQFWSGRVTGSVCQTRRLTRFWVLTRAYMTAWFLQSNAISANSDVTFDDHFVLYLATIISVSDFSYC